MYYSFLLIQKNQRRVKLQSLQFYIISKTINLQRVKTVIILAQMVCGADKCWPTRPRSCRCAQPRGALPHSHDCGAPAHVPVLVPGGGASRVELAASPAPGAPQSLGWCLLPSIRPQPQGQQESSDSHSGRVHFSCAWLQAPSSWCWCWFSAAWSLLGPSQASLMNALALLSNRLSPSEVDRLRSNDQLAAKMQHQEQLKKQVGVLQQRVVDAETKLLKQMELLGESERSIKELDDSIADLRKRIWPSPRLSPRQQSSTGNVLC